MKENEYQTDRWIPSKEEKSGGKILTRKDYQKGMEILMEIYRKNGTKI